MPIPFDQECDESMQSVYSAKSDILAAIKKIQGLATSDTWSGPPADSWMTDLNGNISAVLASLGQPLADAIAECEKNAHAMQVKSGQQAARATAGG